MLVKRLKIARKAEMLAEISRILNTSADYLLGRDIDLPKEVNEEKADSAQRIFPSDDEALKFALFGDNEGITDAQFEEVKQFAKFVKERDKK